MSVYRRKKSNEWYIDYYLPGGKRIREVAGHSKKLAEKLLAKRKTEILEGKYNFNRPDMLLFEELLEKFFEYARSNVKSSTFRRYQTSAKQLKPYFAEKFISQITAYDLEQYKQARIKERTPATINRDLAFLRRVFNQAKKWKMVTNNPLNDVDFYRENNIRTRYYDEDEVKRLLNECKKQPHLFLAVSIALNTGMRKGEILSLQIPRGGEELDKINWIDLENRYFHLNITKTSKHRKVPMNDALYILVEETTSKTEGNSLFQVKYIKRSFKTAMKNAGIENGIFHDLRRTFISHAMMKGYSQEVIQRVVGQDSPDIFKRYAHLAPDLKKEVVNEVGKIFKL